MKRPRQELIIDMVVYNPNYVPCFNFLSKIGEKFPKNQRYSFYCVFWWLVGAAVKKLLEYQVQQMSIRRRVEGRRRSPAKFV